MTNLNRRRTAHHVKITAIQPETATDPAQGMDVKLEIDGHEFVAHEITLHAKAGREVVTATVSFAVASLDVDAVVALEALAELQIPKPMQVKQEPPST